MSSDDYKDLEELGIEDELNTNFTNAANCIEQNASKLDNSILLKLYGYYKQANDGPCNTPKPSWYDLRNKSKWEVWNNLGDLKPDKAKQLYINLVDSLGFEVREKASKEGWVTVSTLQNQHNEETGEKNIIDYIKEGNYEQVLECLEEYSSDEIQSNIDVLDENGLGLIHWAADRGSPDILKMLICKGAKVNLQDSDGQTPLHYAVSCGHVECVELLLENGADVTIKDSDGLDCFSAASDECILSLLNNYKVTM